jgi:YD repeat-containing protein
MAQNQSSLTLLIQICGYLIVLARSLSFLGNICFAVAINLPISAVAKTITTGGYFTYDCGDLGSRLSLVGCTSEIDGLRAKAFSDCMALNSGNPSGFTCSRYSFGKVTRGGTGYIITSQNEEPPWYDAEIIIYTVSKDAGGNQSETTSTVPNGAAIAVAWKCPMGFGGRAVNYDPTSTVRDSICERYEPDPQSCNNVGNPIDPSMADKIQTETDYSSASRELKIVYRSFSARGVGLSNGDAYLHDFTSRRVVSTHLCTYRLGSYYDRNPPTVHEVGICTPYTKTDSILSPSNVVYITLENGQRYQFVDNAGIFTSDAPRGERLSYNANTSEWYFTSPTSEIMVFNSTGRRTRTVSMSGRETTYSYTNNLLTSQSDAFGRTLQFFSDHVILPDGQQIRYTFDSQRPLTTTYQDGAVRVYIYNEPLYTANTNRPALLTGIIDENGNRYATYSYDSAGQAVSTEHAGGVEKYTL